MTKSFENLNKQRNQQYYKDPNEEDFLEEVNNVLQVYDESLYIDDSIRFPFIFTFGPPRSGTTLLTQLLAHCLDTGYINNFMARFWKAPITGIRLSNIFFDTNSFTAFTSDYGSTEHLLDVHEFGYFWRSHLKKHSFESIKKAKESENKIDWESLYQILANIQREFGKPVLFKNILGAYHLGRFRKLLDKVIYVYIKRDSLDTAVSILDARKKYYDDPNTWWSYVPPEYEKIIEEDYWTQIAGQVFYLQKFYDEELTRFHSDHVVQTTYKELCQTPHTVLEKVIQSYEAICSEQLDIIQKPPNSFEYRTHTGREREKKQFKAAFNRLEQYESDNE